MPPKAKASRGTETVAGEETVKRRKLNRESAGESVAAPSTWANATVQKVFQTIAAYSIAGSLYEKKKLGENGQFELFVQGFFGSQTAESKARQVHGNGRFSRMFVESSNGVGPKTVDPFYIYGGEKLIQLESVTYESISRAVQTNTAPISGDALYSKFFKANAEVKKIEAEYVNLKKNGEYPSGSNPRSRAAMVLRKLYNHQLDQKAARSKKEERARAVYGSSEGERTRHIGSSMPLHALQLFYFYQVQLHTRMSPDRVKAKSKLVMHLIWTISKRMISPSMMILPRAT